MEVTPLNGTEFWAMLNTIDDLISKGFYLIWPTDVPELQKALEALLNHFKKPEFKSLLEIHPELQQSITILRELRNSILKAAEVRDKQIKKIKVQKEAMLQMLEGIVNDDLGRPGQGEEIRHDNL